MRLHVVGLPHTEITTKYATCAYSMKLLKFGKMMVRVGHEVVLYAAGDTTDAVCTEYVPLLSTEERLGLFGDVADDPNTTWGHVTWEPSSRPWMLMNHRAIAEISKRAGERDIVCLSAGQAQKVVDDTLPQTCVEAFVGYAGIQTGFCAFESQAWRHHVYGKKGIEQGRWYDTVIPNFFDPDDFKLGSPNGYLVYLGRLIRGKGILVAHELASRAGLPLRIAGPGAASYQNRALTTTDGCLLENVDYLGPVQPADRAELLAGAVAALVPTLYIEPFGGVAVEAMFAGTPAITTQWGAFPETVKEGVSGFRFDTLAGGALAVEKAAALDRKKVRNYAVRMYSLKAVAPLFTRWFEQIDGLRDGGWTA